MTLSLNEVEALARKATRGAGAPWGLAEEAAKATRWLCAWNVDGCAELARLLVACDSWGKSRGARLQGDTWTAPGDRLCPLTAGSALSDLAETLRGKELRLVNVARPILLAPFAALSASGLETKVVLEWGSTRVETTGMRLATEGDLASACATVAVTVGSAAAQAQPRPACSRARPDANTLAILTGLAHRTYAPATEASRLSGAGAGLSDTD